MFDLIGKTVGSYRILEQIGAGGMATVYKAYQPNMDRYIAVKVLPIQLSRDPEFAKRFQREARAIARLEHSHILPVFDYGEYEGITYIAMRYIKAGTLKDRMSIGRLPLEEINRLISQIGSALDYAHRMGVIHRDVKPANVLIDDQGDVYLSDFGLARMMEPTQQITGTGVGLGTPAYMSPEQGQGIKVDHRSDIYSLGILLYEMLTGRVPYEAETPMAVVFKHINGDLPLPHTINPNTPEPVERVILKALAKDPADRYQTVGEMVQALNFAVRMMTAGAEKKTIAEKIAPARQDVSIVTKIQRLWDRPRGRLLLTSGTLAVILLLGFLLLQLPGNITILAPNATNQSPTVLVTSAALPLGSVTIPVSDSTQPLLSDNFDNPIYDSKYNTELWSCIGCGEFGIVKVTQSDSSIKLEGTNNNKFENHSGGLVSQSSWLPGEIGFIQASMKLESTDNGGMNILLRVPLELGGEWTTTCWIGNFSRTTAGYGCDISTAVNGQPKGEYTTETFPIKYGEWHIAKIELIPDTFELRFYLDGKLIGKHISADASILETRFLRASFGIYTDTNIVGYIDDISVGGIQPAISSDSQSTSVPATTTIQPATTIEIAAGKPTTASGFYNHPDLSFPPSGIVDRQIDETGKCAGGGHVTNYWLLPDRQTGWVQVDLGQNYDVTKLRWLNAHNGRCGGQRATTEFHIALSQTGNFNGEEKTIHSGTMTYSLSPKYEDVILSQVILARYVRFYVDGYYGLGGGLNELEVYAEVSSSDLNASFLGQDGESYAGRLCATGTTNDNVHIRLDGLRDDAPVMIKVEDRKGGGLWSTPCDPISNWLLYFIQNASNQADIYFKPFRDAPDNTEYFITVQYSDGSTQTTSVEGWRVKP